jgi:membrane-associated HD superfamily phosphohydrolase
MPAHHLNILAIVVAAFSAFLVGGLWYSPLLFAGSWQRVNGFSAADLASQNKGRTFSLAFILTLVMAFNLAMFLDQPTTTVSWGATAGFLAGFGWVALALGVISLFEARPFAYVAINGGYMVVAFVVMGAIIGAWR